MRVDVLERVTQANLQVTPDRSAVIQWVVTSGTVGRVVQRRDFVKHVPNDAKKFRFSRQLVSGAQVNGRKGVDLAICRWSGFFTGSIKVVIAVLPL
jgi:hypothetical protein